jgi:hypothetical protein
MQWGEERDRIIEGRSGETRCWILLGRDRKVMSIYLKIKEVSKFLPEDESELTQDGAKLRAEIELERYFAALKAKPELKTRV